MPVRASLQPMLAAANALERFGAARTQMKSVAQRRSESAQNPLQMSNVTARVREPVETTDFRVPVSGGEITVRRYRPRRSQQHEQVLPVHVFMHGGSFWLGSVAEYEPLCRWYAARADCAVISVEYRLAPEWPHPTAVEDCYAALCWVAASATALGVDAHRLSVGGVSAGGTLAAVISMLARDRSGPPIVLQVLEIPATDLTMSCASIEEFGEGYSLTKASLIEGYDFYLSDPSQARDPSVSPLWAPDLRGLPPAYVVTCECDPLRDEGEAYARRLSESGVTVTTRRLSGHVHGSMYLTRFLPSARRAVNSTCLALSTAYATAHR